MNILDRIPTWNVSADENPFAEPAKRATVAVIGYAVFVGTVRRSRKPLTLSMASTLASELRRNGDDARVISLRRLAESLSAA